MSGYEGHIEAVGFAGNEVEELERLIKAAQNKADEVTGTVVNAVGDDPRSEAGRNSLDWIINVKEVLGDMVGRCEMIKAELNRYSGGF